VITERKSRNRKKSLIKVVRRKIPESRIKNTKGMRIFEVSSSKNT
jgi:hypothetical protein